MSSFEEELIIRVRANSCLYNSQSRAYKNIVKRDETWAQIAADLNTPVEKCRQRWKSLRDRYVREKKIMSESSGRAAHPDFEVWDLYSSLEFLDECTRPKRIRRGIEHLEETQSAFLNDTSETQQNFNFEEYLIRQEITTPKNEPEAKTPRKEEITATEVIGNLAKVLSQRPGAREADENDLFLKMIGKKMKILPDVTKLRLQAKIFEMVNAEVLEFLETEQV